MWAVAKPCIRTSIAVAAVLFCCAMVSGPTWNKIRRPPLLHTSKNGPVIYIDGRIKAQFVVEMYIVALLNAAVVLGMILMIEAAGGVKSTESARPAAAAAPAGGKRRRFQLVVGLVLVCVFFSMLIYCYRFKNHRYPYSFLFK